MSCSKCGSTTAGCGCKDTAYTTPMPTICVPACPPKCAEYISATCVLMQDGIEELGSNPGDTLESLIQRLTLIITNPLCVDWNPGSGGGGGGGGGIVSVGLVAPSNLFETPITPVTTPGGDLTLTLNDQSSNTVFAGPTSGPANTPQFRALVIDDIPALTTGTSVLMGDGAGKFANVTIGPNLTFSGGVLDANVNVVIGADNGLTKDPLNTDTVWLGGPSTDPGVLIQDTFIDTTDQYRLNLYGDNPAVKRGVLEVEHNDIQTAIKAIADNGTAVSANIIDGVTAVYASSTGSGIGLTAESSSGNAIVYNSDNKAGIIGDSKDENIFNVISTTAPADSTISSVLRLTKKYNTSSAIGIGSRLDFGFYNSANADKTSATIASVTTAVTSGSETADLRFSTIGNGTIDVVGEFIGGNAVLNGQFRLNKYGINSFGTGTPIYGLAVDNQGYVLEVPLASGLGTVDNGLRLNPSVSSEAWLGGALVDDTTITVPNATLFEIAGTTDTATESVLEINNTAGATGTRALSVSSGGLEPAVHITQDTTATSSSIKVINSSTNANALGVDVETKSLPILAKTTQSANTTQVQLLKLHNQTGGSGGNGVGGYISLNAATVGNADQEAARIGYQFTDAATSTRKGQLEFYTANSAVPALRMTIKETGQIQFNNYTTATSFTTTVGASLLGVDTSGNVINSSSTEGILFNPAVGQVQLGYLSDTDAALAGNKFSVNRFLYTDDKTLTIDGIPSLSNAVLRVQNKTLVNSNATYGIWASNGTSVSRNAYAIYGQGGSVGGGVIGTTTNVNTGDGARSFGGDFGIISSNSTPSQLVRTPLRIFSTRVGGGVVNHGAQMLFQLSDDVSTSFDAGTLGYITTSPTSSGDAETTTFFVSTKEAGTVNPVNKLEIDTLGQLKLNKYNTGAFTTGTAVYNLAVDSDGKVMQVSSSAGATPLIKMLASDVSTNNTLADVTDLFFPVTAGKTYYFKFMCPYEINSTTRGSRWTINGPAFSFLSYYSQYSPTTGGADFFRNLNVVAYDTAVATGSTTATTGNIAIIEGVITPSASGSVIARFSTDATAGGTVTCKAGSTITYYTT